MENTLKTVQPRVNSGQLTSTGADLQGANLEGANLKGANLTVANLFRVNLKGAELYGAKYNEKTTFPEEKNWLFIKIPPGMVKAD